MARTPAPGTRKRILDTASRLFGTHGVRAVGMQQMMDESGMGKSLLYREFPSKDDLVTAWLKATDEEWWAQAEEAIAVHEGDPARQLLALVEFVRDGALIAEFHGCVFYNTSAEFRDPGHPGRQEAVSHLSRIRLWLVDLGLAAGARPDAAEELADALMLVIGGLLANSAALGPDGPTRLAIPTARAIIDQYCPVARVG